MFRGDVDIATVYAESGEILDVHEDMHRGKIGIIIDNKASIWLTSTEIRQLQQILSVVTMNE